MPSGVPCNSYEAKCIMLSDSDSSETSSETDNHLAEREDDCTSNDISNEIDDEIYEKGCSLDYTDRDTMVCSLPSMPAGGDEIAHDTSETPAVQCNEVPSDSETMAIHPAVSSGDFDRVVQLKTERDLTESEKVFLLNHHFYLVLLVIDFQYTHLGHNQDVFKGFG